MRNCTFKDDMNKIFPVMKVFLTESRRYRKYKKSRPFCLAFGYIEMDKTSLEQPVY